MRTEAYPIMPSPAIVGLSSEYSKQSLEVKNVVQKSGGEDST